MAEENEKKKKKKSDAEENGMELKGPVYIENAKIVSEGEE